MEVFLNRFSQPPSLSTVVMIRVVTHSIGHHPWPGWWMVMAGSWLSIQMLSYSTNTLIRTACNAQIDANFLPALKWQKGINPILIGSL